MAKLLKHVTIDAADGSPVYTADIADEEMRSKIGTVKVTSIDSSTAVPTSKAVKDYVDGKVSSAVHIRGSVADITKLPANPAVGDLYNVESSSAYGEAGTNVVWTGSAWDSYGGATALASSSENGLMSSSDKQKLDGITPGASHVSGKVQSTVVTSVKVPQTIVTSCSLQSTVVTGATVLESAIKSAVYTSSDETLTLSYGSQNVTTGSQSSASDSNGNVARVSTGGQSLSVS